MSDPVLNDDSRHVQAQSIAILGAATVALVLGVFGGYFRSKANVEFSVSTALKLIASFMAIVHYVILAKSVNNILLQEQNSKLNGKFLAHGPLFWMMQMMECIILVFLVDVIQLFVR